MPLEPGTLLLQRYRLERILGQGGFGAVYLAFDEILEQPCAVKENRSSSPEGGRQFLKEARLLANLRHPSLPRVTHHFEVGKSQFLVMDFVEGEDLAERLRRVGRLPLEDVLPWCGQIGRALSYLHGLDPPVFHRDVKPANIKITPQGEAILVDFGIAKESGPGQTTSTGAKGVTPGYGPPEQYGLGHTDARTDVYALGATLYALLTAQSPPDSVERLLGTIDLVAPETIVPNLPPHVVRAIHLAMRPNKEDRLADVSTLLHLLDDPGLTWPPPVAPAEEELALADRRETNRRRRHDRRWIAAGLVLFLLSCGSLVFATGPEAAPWMVSALQESGISIPGVPSASKIILIRATPAVLIATSPPTQNPTASLGPTLTAIPSPTPIPVVAGLQNASGWRRFGSWSSDGQPLVFSLAADGDTAAVVRGQGVDLVDPITGEVKKSLQGFLINRTPYAVVHRGDTLLVGVEGEILLWNVATNNLIETFPIPGKELRLSPSGDLLAVRDKYITILSLETGQRLTSLGEPDSDQQFALSPDDRYLALTKGADVALWNLKEGVLERRLVGHGEPTLGLAFTVDGSRLVSASGDVWEVASGKLVGVFDSATDRIAVSPNGELAVGRDGSVWGLPSGQLLSQIGFEREDPGSLQFTPDGRFLIRNVGSAAELWTVDPEAKPGDTVEPAGEEIAGEAIGDLNLYRLTREEPFGTDGYDGVAVSADGHSVAAWRSRTLRVFRLQDEALLADWSVSGIINDAAFLGDDFVVVLVGGARTERWELASGRVMQTYPVGGGRLEASPAGDFFAVQSKYIQVVEALTGKVVHSLGSANAKQDYVFTPDGRQLLIAAGPGVGVWDTTSGRLVRQLAGHGPPVTGLDVTPDGRRAGAASGDVWDLESGKLLPSFAASAHQIALSHDGKLIIDSDGTTRNAATGFLIGNLDTRMADPAFVLDDRMLVGLGSGSRLLAYRVAPLEAPARKPLAEPGLFPALTSGNLQELALLGWWGQDALLSIRYGRDGAPPGAKAFGTETYRVVIPSPDGVTVTALGAEGVDLLDPARGIVVASYRMFLNPSWIEDIAYAGTDLIVVKGLAGVERWDLEGSRLLQRYEIEAELAGASADGTLVGLQHGSRLQVIALASAEMILDGLAASPGRQHFAFSSDAKLLAAAHGGLVEVWDLAERRRVRILRSRESSVGGLFFSPDGTQLIAASGTIWAVASGERTVEFASPSEVGALSGDGSFLIEGSGGVWAADSGARQATLFDLRAPGDQVVLTGNGRALLMRTADGKLYVWSARQLPPPEAAPQGPQVIGAVNAGQLKRVGHLGRGRLRQALWSPADTFLAVNTTLNAIVYEAETLSRLQSFEGAEIVGFDADGHALVGGAARLIRIDSRTGEVLEEIGLTGIHAAAYSPDGAWLAVAGHVSPEARGDGIALIALADGLLRVLDSGRDPDNVIERLVFTPDSRRLVASHFLAVSIWEVDTGLQVRDPIQGNRRRAAISPDGTHIAYLIPNWIVVETLDKGATFRRVKADGTDFWKTGVEIPRLEPVDIDFLGDTSLVVFYRRVHRDTGQAVAAVAVLDLEKGTGMIRTSSLMDLSRPTGAYTDGYETERPQVIPAFGLSPSGTRLFSVTSDGIVRVWTTSGAPVAETNPEWLEEMALSPDGSTLVVPDALGGLAVIDLATGDVVSRVDGSWDPRQLAFGSRSLLTVLQDDGTVSQVDIGKGRLIESWRVEGWGAADLLTVSPDGRLVAVFRRFAGDNRVLVFSLAPDRPLLDLGRFPLPALPAFAPDGTTLAMVRREAVELWDLQRGEVRRQIDGAGDDTGMVRFHPDGEYLITGRGAIWPTDGGDKVGSVNGPLGIFAVSPNGEVLVKNDGSLWDARDGQSLGWLEGVVAPAVQIVFAPNGRQLLWMRAGGVVEIWAVAP